jgi:hypothetical protein
MSKPSQDLELCTRFDEKLTDISDSIDNIRSEFSCLSENEECKRAFRDNLISIREEAQRLIRYCGEILTHIK